jgi:dTDP-4-amino-4,6-dideoxygalactose transaminase
VTPHVELLGNETRLGIQKRVVEGRIYWRPMVEDFEKAFAQYCDTQYCVGVSSGTDALRFALTAAGINAGDAVVTVPNTFIATTEAISQAGAIPEFVDVDPNTHNMDPEKLREFIETRCDVDDATGDQ